MSLLHFSLAALGVFALLQFLWLPWLRHRLRVDRTVASVRRAAWLALLGWVRGVALIATLTMAVLVVVLFFLLRRGGGTVAELSASVEALQGWRDRLVGFGPYWSGGALLALVVFLGVYAYRGGKKRLEKAFREVYERQLNQILERGRRGELEELPPTADMVQLADAFQHHQQVLESVGADPDLTDIQRQALQAELQRRLVFLRENWVLIDVHRRLDLKLDPDEALPPAPRTRFEKLQTFLISQGLLVNLNRATRLLYQASLVLLMGCLVGVCSPKVGLALGERILALDDLRVRLSREQVQQEWEQAKADLGQPLGELAAADVQVVDQVAARYEQAVGKAELWRPTSVVRPSSYLLRALAVQDAVLQRAARPTWAAPGEAHLELHPALSRVSDLEPHERFVVQAYEHARDLHGPVTDHGRRFAGELKQAARRSPGLMGRLRAEVRLFQRPASAGQLSTELTSQVVALVAGGEQPELVSLLGGIDRRATSNLVQRLLADDSRRALSQLARGSSLPEVLQGVGEDSAHLVFVRLAERAELKQTMRAVLQNLPRDEAVLARLRNHPPSVDVKLETHVNAPRATAAVERFQADLLGARAPGQGKPVLTRADTERFTTSLSSYADDVPAQLGAEHKTLQGRLLSKLEQQYGLKAAPAAAAETRASQFKFLQGRDINRVRGFSRVGGVLIGREPTNGTAGLSVVDLRWEADGPNLRLLLGTQDGQQVRSRPYRRSLVYLALAYAADGRKVTVTIAEANPLGEHSILLHPTLVDTPLGRRVIDLDQFISRYTKTDKQKDEQIKKALEVFVARDEFYRWAWAKRVCAMTQFEIDGLGALLRPEISGKLVDGVRQVRDDAKQVVDGANTKLLAEAWATRTGFGDPKSSPWVARKRYYDENLVRLILDQTGKASSLEEFGPAFDRAAEAEYRRLIASVHEAADDQKEELLREVFFYRLMDPPSYGLRNIVRERAFAADLSQILPPDDPAQAVAFDFFLQMVFTSEPYFAGRHPGAAEAEDDRWWEFETLSPSIQELVLRGANRDAKAKAVLADVSEFTYLQRLFRAALQGQLGEQFPVEKLVALTEAAAPAAGPAPSRTLRWDMRAGPREVVNAGLWLQVLGVYLPRLDPSWQPTWLQQRAGRDPLDEADFAKVLGQWSEELKQQLDRLPPSGDPRLEWCRGLFPVLEHYRSLLAEAAEARRRFKQATDALARQRVQAGPGPEPTAWRRAWDEELDAFARRQADWGRRWEQTKARHTFAAPPAVADRTAKDRGADCYDTFRSLVRLVEQCHAAQEIRLSLGVAKDERQTLEERIAPLPGLDW